MKKEHNWHHDQLANDLASHLRGNSDRVVWTDMQLGPSGSPRPDVYTINKSYLRFCPLAYEIKISVSDFRRDVTSGKWQSYLKFAAGVIFAVPAGLIKKDDVPPGCGLIVRHDEVWRTVKGPTLQHLGTLPHSAWMKLMIDGLDRQGLTLAPRSLSEWRAQQAIRKQYGDKLGDLLKDRDYAEHRLLMAHKEADAAADRLAKETREFIENGRERMRRENSYIDDARRELCKSLGLPVDASHYDITSACREAAKRLEESAEIIRLRQQLENIQEALNKGLAPIPPIGQQLELRIAQ